MAFLYQVFRPSLNILAQFSRNVTLLFSSYVSMEAFTLKMQIIRRFTQIAELGIWVIRATFRMRFTSRRMLKICRLPGEFGSNGAA